MLAMSVSELWTVSALFLFSFLNVIRYGTILNQEEHRQNCNRNHSSLFAVYMKSCFSQSDNITQRTKLKMEMMFPFSGIFVPR